MPGRHRSDLAPLRLDLAGETLIGGFTGVARFRGDEAGLRSWVFTIAHRRLLDDWRRRSRRPRLADDPDSRADVTGDVVGDAEDDAPARIGRTTCAGGVRNCPRTNARAGNVASDGTTLRFCPAAAG